MVRRLSLAVAVILIVAACTVENRGETTSTAETTRPSSGRLVILDDDGGVATLDPDGTNRVSITDDVQFARYFQPVWSPAERQVAFGVGDPAGFSVIVAADDGSDSSQVSVSGFPFYLNWSPDGSQIGVLHNQPEGDGLDFELIDVGAATASVVDSGSPYYFSWSPESDAVVVHVGGDRLEIFDESGSPLDIGPTSASYLSPRWTPEGIFFLGPQGVALRRDAGDVELIAQAEGFVSINPNPMGTKVAIHSLLEDETLTVSRVPIAQSGTDGVTVVDVTAGTASQVVDTLSVGSFWSHDGSKLLVFAVEEGPLVDVVLWEDGETVELLQMELSITLLSEALAFFDQYAQSWNIWSPGSDAVVFPGSIDGDSGIWVIPTDGSPPSKVADGDWAAWSYD